MGCSRSGATETALLSEDGEPTGILKGHAYGITKFMEIPDNDMENPRKTHRLVLVRNPWGKDEWLLDWSAQSDKLDMHMDKIKAAINEFEEEERFDPTSDSDGLFFMNYKNFRSIFNKIFVARDFPNEWWCIRYSSHWTKDCSGGLPAPMNAQTCKRYATNPQYMLQPSEDCEVFLSLGQNDGRGKDEQSGEYEPYPFKTRLEAAHLAIWQLN